MAQAEAATASTLPERRTLRQVWDTGRGIGWRKPVAQARRELLAIGFDLFAVDRDRNFLVYWADRFAKVGRTSSRSALSAFVCSERGQR
jgi:hypothetical protein